MVKKLVRLALASEYQRRPIRRADISEKVLGSQGRQFKAVFDQAQQDLRAVFGMELRELPAKDKVTLQQRRGKNHLVACLVDCHEILTVDSRCEVRQTKQDHRLLGAHFHSTSCAA